LYRDIAKFSSKTSLFYDYYISYVSTVNPSTFCENIWCGIGRLTRLVKTFHDTLVLWHSTSVWPSSRSIVMSSVSCVLRTCCQRAWVHFSVV